MELIKELLGLQDLTEANKKESGVSRKASAAVYHRDYLKTKNKEYRKYDKTKRKANKNKED